MDTVQNYVTLIMAPNSEQIILLCYLYVQHDIENIMPPANESELFTDNIFESLRSAQEVVRACLMPCALVTGSQGRLVIGIDLGSFLIFQTNRHNRILVPCLVFLLS